MENDPKQVSNSYGTSGTGKITAGLKQKLKALMKEYKTNEALKILVLSKDRQSSFRLFNKTFYER